MYLYQNNHRYFAQISDEIKELGLQELEMFHAKNCVPLYRGIEFEASKEDLYRINYGARLITRVLAPLISFPCKSPDDIYHHGKMIHWEDFFKNDHTFAIFATVSNSEIKHSQFAGLRLKDAIADYFSEKYSSRPNVDKNDPDIWFNLHIEKNVAVISLDTSGGSLHRRGYRKGMVEASMQETVAAAMIQMAEWDGSKPLYDPFCGSGTILGEALMKFCRIPSGFLRKKFGFEHMPDVDFHRWKDVKYELNKKIRYLPKGLIQGSDISNRAILLSTKNLENLPYHQNVEIKKMDFQDIKTLEQKVIITNPPYGIRMKPTMKLEELYQRLGDFLKQRCKGSVAYIYFGNRELIKCVGLKPTWKKPLNNGGLEGRLVKYEIY